MKATVSGVTYTGSYWMSAIPFAASIACIDKMKKLNTPKMFREMGTKLTEGFKAPVKSMALTLWLPVNRHSSIFVSQTMTALCFIRSGYPSA